MGKRICALGFGAFSLAVILGLMAGCGKPTAPPVATWKKPRPTATPTVAGKDDQKRTRLIAAENAQLKKDLASRISESKLLSERHVKELARQEKLFAQCQAEKKALQNDVKQGIDQRVKGVTEAVMLENAKLREQVTQLQAELDKLRGQSKTTAEPNKVP